MTQYMLIVGIQPKDTLESLGIIGHTIYDSNNFLREVANQLFSKNQIQSCWYPESEVIGSVHDLFNEAYKNIQQGMSINETVVGNLLLNVLPLCEEIVLWYSDDFHDLPCIENTEKFMSTISCDLMQDSGELYLRFHSVG